MNQLRLTERYKYKETEQGKCFEVWYKSNQIKKHQRIRKYIVATDLTEGKEEFSCICGKFNKDGILCAHILKVIVEEEINKIPEKYFIDRWRKKNTKFHITHSAGSNTTHELLKKNIKRLFRDCWINGIKILESHFNLHIFFPMMLKRRYLDKEKNNES